MCSALDLVVSSLWIVVPEEGQYLHDYPFLNPRPENQAHVKEERKKERKRKKNEILAKTQTTHKNNTLVKHWFHY